MRLRIQNNHTRILICAKNKEGNMWNKKVKKEIKKAFNKTKLNLDFGNGYLSIYNSKGISCEFYPCYSDESLESEILTATYKVDGKIRELDLCIPEDTYEFVDVVKKILK